MTWYGITRRIDQAVFSLAMSILTKSELGYLAKALQILDTQGVIIIDFELPAADLGLTDSKADGWVHGKRYIRINPSFFGNEGIRTKKHVQRYLAYNARNDAIAVAPILCHELYHYNYGTWENPAWKHEVKVRAAILAHEEDEGTKNNIRMEALGRLQTGYSMGYFDASDLKELGPLFGKSFAEMPDPYKPAIVK